MTIAVLPFNAGPDTRPALARQLANFACDIVRNHTGAEVNAVNYLIRLDESPNPRFANVNASETLNEPEMLNQLFEQAGADKAVDGLLVEKDGKLELDVRVFAKGTEQPIEEQHYSFGPAESFGVMRSLIEMLAKHAEKELPDEVKSDTGLFGTTNGEAFLKFLESYDALQYIEKTQGRVAEEFSPDAAMLNLVEAAKLDSDWEAPYVTGVQIARACANHQIGEPEKLENALRSMIEVAPDDARGLFALGELLQAMGRLEEASNTFEKAAALEPNEPAILTRLGIVQMQMGMPVNAERNFKKAMEMEDETKPSLDFLAQVLQQSGRAHEVPPLYQDLIWANEQNAQAYVKMAMAQVQAGAEDQALETFEQGLAKLEDKTIVKRYYAPMLAQKQEFDRAMDFYEDCMEVAPNDVQLLLEYAQTLQAAGREFEVPKILKQALDSNPDPNTRAQTLAWLTELEQPKRVETVVNAQHKLEANDADGAVRDLKPMKNWLADYWKMWAILANALNRIGQHEEAEDAATRLLNLFPGCEPGFAELATALGGQGKNEEAYNMLRYAMSQIQNSLPIALNYALAAKRTGREDEAKQMSRQIREAVGKNPDIDPILDEIDR